MRAFVDEQQSALDGKKPQKSAYASWDRYCMATVGLCRNLRQGDHGDGEGVSRQLVGWSERSPTFRLGDCGDASGVCLSACIGWSERSPTFRLGIAEMRPESACLLV